MKHTTESFIAKSQEIYGDKYDYSKTNYIDSKTKVCIICLEHGEFWQAPRHHLSGQGCKLCTIRGLWTIEEFIEKAKEVHGDKYDYSKSEYVNTETKLCVICPIHGEFKVSPNAHIHRKSGCPQCGHENTANTIRHTTIDFIKKAKEIHGNKYDYSKVVYKNNSTKVCIICPEHGEFWQTPASHVSGAGCPRCNQSHLEQIVEMTLTDNNIKHEPQKSFEWLKYKSKMFLDFYLLEYNIAIECQGKQHFELVDIFGGEEEFQLRQQRDKVKKQLCEQHGIKILYFSDKKHSDEIITNIDDVLKTIEL